MLQICLYLGYIWQQNDAKFIHFGEHLAILKEKTEICEEMSGLKVLRLRTGSYVIAGRSVSRIGRSVSRGEAQQRPTYQSSDPMDISEWENETKDKKLRKWNMRSNKENETSDQKR